MSGEERGAGWQAGTSVAIMTNRGNSVRAVACSLASVCCSQLWFYHRRQRADRPARPVAGDIFGIGGVGSPRSLRGCLAAVLVLSPPNGATACPAITCKSINGCKLDSGQGWKLANRLSIPLINCCHDCGSIAKVGCVPYSRCWPLSATQFQYQVLVVNPKLIEYNPSSSSTST